jgi:flagellin
MAGIAPVTDLRAQFFLRRNREAEEQALTRLASGRRLNRGSDDPAGMISSERLEAAIAALEAESRVINRQDSRVSAADGRFSQVSSMLAELRGKQVAAASSGALSADELAAHQLEVDSLVSSIQKFAGEAVAELGPLGLAGGENSLAAQMQQAAAGLSQLATGGSAALGSGSGETARAALDAALGAFSTARGTLGAYQKYELQGRQDAIARHREGLIEAQSRIRDADFAAETSNLARSRVLVSATIEALRISQQNTAAVLALLR